VLSDSLQYLVIWYLSSGLMGGRLKEFYSLSLSLSVHVCVRACACACFFYTYMTGGHDGGHIFKRKFTKCANTLITVYSCQCETYNDLL